MLAMRTLCLAAVLALAACASAPVPAPAPSPIAAAPADIQRAANWYAARQTLSVFGALRVGVYAGSPSSLVRDAKTGQVAGVAHDLGVALAREFGVPVQIVEFERLALVLDALKAGAVDMTFTNATELRARDVDFTPTLLQVELGFLVPQGSKIVSAADVDQTGVRIGVSQGSSSQAALPRELELAFEPLHKRAFGMAIGVATGLVCFLVTAVMLLRQPGETFNLLLLREYFYGYSVTWQGAFIALAWGFVVGFVAGWFAAFCRNFIIAASLWLSRTRGELDASRDFLDHI